MCLLEEYAVASHNSFVEGKPRFGTVPVGEFAYRMLVGASRSSVKFRLLRTAVFECSRSGSRSTDLGLRLRFGFPIRHSVDDRTAHARFRSVTGFAVSEELWKRAVRCGRRRW